MGKLVQGNNTGVRSTDTIDFIYSKVPERRNVTYATYVLDHRPLKTELYIVRITVDGDRLTIMEDSGSPSAKLLETNVSLNSTISDAKQGAKCMTADIKDVLSIFLSTNFTLFTTP